MDELFVLWSMVEDVDMMVANATSSKDFIIFRSYLQTQSLEETDNHLKQCQTQHVVT